MQTGGGAEFLLDFAARKLNASQHAVVERHIGACGDCAEFVRGQSALWDALDEWGRIEISPDFNRRLYHRVDDEQSRWFSRWKPLSWRPAASVAAVCAALVIALWAPSPFHPPPTVEKVDVEQVERTLDDLEMLKQFSPKL